MKNMFSEDQAESYREGFCNQQGYPFETKLSTGRATCRACGKKIIKNQIALYGFHDFYGYGSITSTNCWIHNYNCISGEK